MRSNTQSITAQVSELGRQPVAITGGADGVGSFWTG